MTQTVDEPPPPVEQPPEASPGSTPEPEPEPDPEPEPEPAYDPSQYGVEAVNQHLAENPDQRDAVIAAERAGKNRKGITGDE